VSDILNINVHGGKIMNPLHALIEHGQSYWLDNLTRGMLRGGELRRRVETEGLRGVTSNPAIFHKAITGSADYDAQIAALAAERRPVEAIYEALVIEDVREACEVLQPVHEESRGADGYVSLEVSPHLAHDTPATLREARRLAAEVDRPNLMIKVPGTRAGLPAVEELLFEGINVNVTLLFSVRRYEQVAQAWLRALERRREANRPLADIASVASFFLSRIDILVDQLLRHRMGPGTQIRPDPRPLLGKTALSNAKLAYQSFKGLFDGERWRSLADEGARVQRLLWASTSVKDPGYSDLMYVEPLIGRDTVNTMPDVTVAAFAEHGRVEDTVERGTPRARRVMADLRELGIDPERVGIQLENEGVQKFIEPYDALLSALAKKCEGA
jgi:transaldolase